MPTYEWKCDDCRCEFMATGLTANEAKNVTCAECNSTKLQILSYDEEDNKAFVLLCRDVADLMKRVQILERQIKRSG